MLMESGEHQATPVASERSFGVVFFIVFALVAAYGLWSGWSVAVVASWAALSVLTLLLGLFAPKTLQGPNRLWAKFGLLLALVLTPIIMALVFFLAVTPSGLLMRLFGTDPMKRKVDATTSSYWIKREKRPGPMRYQF